MIEFIIALWISLFGCVPTTEQVHNTLGKEISYFDATARAAIAKAEGGSHE